jgi:methyl-accepting chemotaxis protein
VFRFITGHIRNKLMVTMVGLSLLAVATLGVLADRTASSSLRDRVVAQLAATSAAKQARVAALFQTYSHQVEVIAADPDIRQRAENVAAGGDARRLAAEMEERLRPQVKNLPGVVHATILNTRGAVVADTLPAQHRNPPQALAKNVNFRGATANPGKVFIQPLSQSETGHPGSAVAVTLAGKKGKPVGVAVIHFTTAEVDRILTDRTGMGDTGESYLVASQVTLADKTRQGARLMATSSRFVKDSILRQTVDTVGASGGLAKKTGWAVYPNYQGAPVLGHYTWLPELKAALLSEIATDEAFASISDLRGTILWVAVVVLAVVLGVAYLLAGGLTRQVNHITETFGQIGLGDFKARVRVSSGDELGQMAVSLNAMLDNTLGLIQSRDERDRIQQSIQKLLEEISGVAEGDLTKEAEVTADVTGAIADSFNHMIEQLRNIISSVQDATLQVSSSATEIHSTAEHLAHGSETQSLQIVNTSAAVKEMATSIQQVSENASQSAKVAEQALANARQGAEAVNNTIGGMNRIRDQVQETAKRIKRLGESSQQIGEIVQLIDDIADRTSILALNASIQAAMAGEAGRGFAVVAEEVERLAERSTNATKKIAGLVKAIQSETNEAVTAMEEGTREVVEGSKLANQAGQALSEIQTVSGRLADLIQSISQASRQQARVSESVAKSMTQISDVTQQTAAGNKQAAVSVNSLASLADELRSSVSTFRLPGMNTLHEGQLPPSLHELSKDRKRLLGNGAARSKI